jgi:long-chain acyl-CoA synthetase
MSIAAPERAGWPRLKGQTSEFYPAAAGARRGFADPAIVRECDVDVIWAFRRATRKEANRTFIFDLHETVSYLEADQRSDAIATGYIDAGLSPGQTIGLCSPDSVPLILAIVGAWKAGLIPGLIDARTSDEDLPYFVEDVGAKLVLAPPALHDRLQAAGANQVADLESFGGNGGNGGDGPRPDHHGPKAPLYLSYTSGTTGKPKGAVLRSGPVSVGTSCIADRLGIGREDVLLATTPTSSSFQLVAALMPAIHAGASIGMAAGLATDQMWDLARDRHASVLVAYPLTLADMVNNPAATRPSSPFRVALSGGSPLAPRIKRDYRDRLGIPLLESYGQSELGGFMAMGSTGDGERAFEGFVGRPLPDRPAYVVGPDLAELPAGEVGEVVVPFGYFDSYINKPDRTEEALAGGVLHTGDVAVADPDGYLKVMGRTNEADAATTRGGFLREAEDTFYDHPAVLHAAVVQCRDGMVEAFVELLPGGDATEEDLATFAAERLPGGLRPRRTNVLDKMPRTFSGKANRLLLSKGCG